MINHQSEKTEFSFCGLKTISVINNYMVLIYLWIVAVLVLLKMFWANLRYRRPLIVSLTHVVIAMTWHIVLLPLGERFSITGTARLYAQTGHYELCTKYKLLKSIQMLEKYFSRCLSNLREFFMNKGIHEFLAYISLNGGFQTTALWN